MGASSRRKGAAWEATVASWLCDNGWPHAERRSAGMSGSDILGVLPFEIECKNRKDVAAAIADAVDAAHGRCGTNIPGSLPVAIVKRPRRSHPANAYVVMPLWAWNLLALCWDARDTGREDHWIGECAKEIALRDAARDERDVAIWLLAEARAQAQKPAALPVGTPRMTMRSEDTLYRRVLDELGGRR